MNLVPVLYWFGQFIWVGAFQIYIDLHDIDEPPLLIEKGAAHVRELLDKFFEAFPDCPSLHIDDLLTVGEPTEGQMKMDLYAHV